MATYYALPALTTWNTTSSTTNGFASTSGGAPLGNVSPAAADTVVFDANSGPSRAITTAQTGTVCQVLTVSAGAANFTFGELTVGAGGTATLNAGSSMAMLRCATGGAGAVTVTCNGGYIGNVFFAAGTGIALGGIGNFGAVAMGGGSLTTNNYDFTAASVTSATTGGSYNWNVGTSNIAINCTISGPGIYDTWNGSNQASITGSPNLTFNIASTSTGYASIGPVGTGNITVNSPGPGFAYFTSSGSSTNSITIRGNLVIGQGLAPSANAWVIDGNGAYGGVAVIKSTSTGIGATLVRRDANVSYFDRIKAGDISFQSNSGKAFYSRSDQGSGSGNGLTKIPANARFLTFF